MATQADFPAVFGQLKTILQELTPPLVVQIDTPDTYYLKTARPYFKSSSASQDFFGGVQIRKNYVSFHLMPIYASPQLLEGLSENLRKRKQGKSCFNFKSVDPALFAELKDLVQRSIDRFKKAQFV